MSTSTSHFTGPFGWSRRVDYSQVVRANGLLFVSGQFGCDDDGAIVSDDFVLQARKTFDNLRRVLEDAGAGFGDLVQVRCFLRDVKDFDEYKQVRREVLAPPYPTSLVVCSPEFTFDGMLIEIEAIAALPS